MQQEGQQQVTGAQMAAVPLVPAYKSWCFLPSNERAVHTGLRMFYIDATGDPNGNNRGSTSTADCQLHLLHTRLRVLYIDATGKARIL